MITRTQIINALITSKGYKSYLEIGVNNKDGNFNHINCDLKWCVDPDPLFHADYIMDSDAFFDMNTRKYDLIFVDGLHHEEQVSRDMINALDSIVPHGTVVCHDMNPHSEIIQRIPRATQEWTGDCWKSWIKFRSFRPDLIMYVVDGDYGVGVMQKGVQKLLRIKGEATYENFDVNRKEWLNLISPQQFLEKL